MEIDDERGRLIIRTKKGDVRSRPLDELRRIWEALQKESAIHVDKVLNGSGTSRNQPETILANLPYIEWLKIDNKKHIAYVGESTHPFGTLKKMDPLKAVEITAELHSNHIRNRFSAMIASKDINTCISSLQEICSGTITALEPGAYQFETGNNIIVFVSAEKFGLQEGTYCVIEAHNYKRNAQLKRLSFYGHVYIPENLGSTNLLIRDSDSLSV